MKYATLLLGAALLLASIITARAIDVAARCGNTRSGPSIDIDIEKIMVSTCPDKENCQSFKFVGYKVIGVPLDGAELRIKSKTPRRGVSTLGPEIVEVTLNGKRCQFDD